VVPERQATGGIGEAEGFGGGFELLRPLRILTTLRIADFRVRREASRG
jgi:hypothetical protein